MTIFTVLMPTPQPNLAANIKQIFPKDHLPLNDTQWLISTTGTAVELVAKLGIYDATQPQKPPTGIALVFSISAYYGRGPTSVWDWINAKLEAPSGG